MLDQLNWYHKFAQDTHAIVIKMETLQLTNGRNG